MKLSSAQVERFLERPDPEVCGVLLYGPDGGLVRERADRIVAAIAGSPWDPFRVTELTAAMMREHPGRLAEEAAALGFGGGRRVVRLRDGGEAMASALTGAVCEAGRGGALLVVEAGDLAPRSALRRLFETASAAVALPCYHDEASDLDRVVEQALATWGVAITPEARGYLVANLGGDRGVTQMELEKLALYVGGESRASLEDVQRCIGNNAALSLDDLVFAVADGDATAMERVLPICIQDGVSPVAMLRGLARHLMRLHQVRTAIDRGIAAGRALRDLRPPVFYKLTDRFYSQAAHWTGSALGLALARVIDAEAQCKRTGLPAEAICQRALMQISQQAARQKRR